jgi:hypothetical protein
VIGAEPIASTPVEAGMGRMRCPTPSEEAPMTTKADFSEEDWARLKRAPFVAGLAISLADPAARSRP